MEDKVFVLENELQVIQAVERQRKLETAIRIVHGKLPQIASLLLRVVRCFSAAEPEGGAGYCGEEEAQSFPSRILLAKLCTKGVESSSGVHEQWAA